MNLCKSALDLLEETSRTFYIPISRLPGGLQEAVASGYLCMRAIDEVEDHPELDNPLKAEILRIISLTLQSADQEFSATDLEQALKPYAGVLPEVSLRVGEWAILAPQAIAPRVWDATAAMSDRMAHWASINWTIESKADLDRYTFGVAGAVGLLLSDLWAWFDGTKTNRMQAIGFGRGLQAVNILRNHHEDTQRGVEFFPPGWTAQRMQVYAKENLALADAYTEALPLGPALEFCRIPLALAHATLEALDQGEEKLSRHRVMALVQQLTSS